MAEVNGTADSTHSAEFLLAEYGQLNEETRRLRGEGLARLNFFITLSSTTLAGLVLLGQSSVTTNTSVLLVGIGALTFLVILGWSAFRFTISRDISTDLNIRAIGRIHRYFIDHDPLLFKYLIWQSHDEPTPWVTRNTSNLRSTAQSILSTLIAIDIGLIVHLTYNTIVWSIAAGILVFVTTLFLLDGYAKRRFNKANLKGQQEVIFPKSGTAMPVLSTSKVEQSNTMQGTVLSKLDK